MGNEADTDPGREGGECFLLVVELSRASLLPWIRPVPPGALAATAGPSIASRRGSIFGATPFAWPTGAAPISFLIAPAIVSVAMAGLSTLIPLIFVIASGFGGLFQPRRH
jgi:hypothetical protein